MNDVVSIIVPVYNGAVFLRRCIDSILSQSYSFIEVIIVDDGSIDDTYQICQQYKLSDKRIKIIHKNNEGVSKARIDGYIASTGKYVSFVDADDYLAPSFVYTLLSAICSFDSDVVVCQYYDVLDGLHQNIRSIIGTFDSNSFVSILSSRFLYDRSIHSSGIPVFLWGKIFRKEVLRKSLSLGFGYKYGEDMIVFLDIFMSNIKRITVLPECLYYYYHHPKQVTKRPVLDSFPDYLALWEKIEEMDINRYFATQLPDRMNKIVFQSIYRIVREKRSYHEYIKLVTMIRDSPVVNNNMFNNSHYVKTISNYNQFILLKHRCYLPLYLFFLWRIKREIQC